MPSKLQWVCSLILRVSVLAEMNLQAFEEVVRPMHKRFTEYYVRFTGM